MGSPLMLNSETVPSMRSLTDLTGRRETSVINIRDCRSGLGIKIAGGRSSLGADFGIFVKKVLTGGAADVDGGLREGDLLLEVNGCSLVGISNEKAMSVLRNAAQSNEAKLLVSRDSQAREDFGKLMTALNGEVSSLPSSFMNGLPMSSLTRTSSFGSSSSRASTPSPRVGKRSWVVNEGRMSPLAGGRHGSPILSPTNSIDRPSASLQRMYSMDLPTVPVGPTVVQHTPGAHEPPSYNSTLQKLSTPSTDTMYPPQLSGLAHSMERSPNYMYNSNQLTVEQQSVSSEVTNDSGLPTDRHSASSSPAFDHPTGELQSIQVTHSRGLGLCIVGGTNRTEGPHIYVDDIIEGGDAHRDGRLRRGDRLIFVNGETLVGVTHEQAKSLLTRLKLRSQDAKIAFIRGGLRPDNPISNSVFNSAQSSPRESLENEMNDASSQDLQLNLNGIDNSNSRPSSSRSSQISEADLSNTEIFMQELLAGPTTDSTTINGNSNQAGFGDYHSSPQPMISPPVISDTQPAVIRPVISQQVQAVESPINPVEMPSSLHLMSSGNPQLPSAAIPMRNFLGFQPAMSSTPTVNGTVANGIPLSVHGAPSFNHMYLNGRVNSQLHDNTALPFSGNGAGLVHISPVQTTFEQSSVPYYLQQDLTALQQLAHQKPVPGQQSLLTTPSVGGPKGRRHGHGSRRLSLDPHTRLRVEKLEVALRYLGFKPTEEQQFELRQRLPSDSNGFVSYGDFVNAAREVFSLELSDHSLNNSAVQFAVQDLNSLPDREGIVQMQQQSQQVASLEAIAKQSAEDVERIRRERDEALREVQHLKRLLKKKEESCMTAEEELMKARREAQGLLAESRSLEKRVHLASEAQKAAKDVEQDYAEVIRLLEKELDAYKAKEAEPKPDVKELQELQKRLVVLGCQLRKAEVSKRTYEVATEKLIHFAEMVHECLTEGATGRSQQRGRGESVRRETGSNPKPPTYLSRHAKYSPASLAKEARDAVKSVKAIIEEEPLPFGWEEAYTTDGVRYYINHVTQQTSWLHPVSQVQHLPPIVENEEKVRETST